MYEYCMCSYHMCLLNLKFIGRRVIGYCYSEFSAPFNTRFTTEMANYPTSKLCFLGMAAIMDAPREDSIPAIAACKQAGIKVFMITGKRDRESSQITPYFILSNSASFAAALLMLVTMRGIFFSGDHPITAASIARQVGLLGATDEVKTLPGRRQSITLYGEGDGSEESDVIHGEQIGKLTEAQWDEILGRKYVVFARTTPEQKLAIVEQCQKRKEIVAVTGTVSVQK